MRRRAHAAVDYRVRVRPVNVSWLLTTVGRSWLATFGHRSRSRLQSTVYVCMSMSMSRRVEAYMLHAARCGRVVALHIRYMHARTVRLISERVAWLDRAGFSLDRRQLRRETTRPASKFAAVRSPSERRLRRLHHPCLHPRARLDVLSWTQHGTRRRRRLRRRASRRRLRRGGHHHGGNRSETLAGIEAGIVRALACQTGISKR